MTDTDNTPFTYEQALIAALRMVSARLTDDKSRYQAAVESVPDDPHAEGGVSAVLVGLLAGVLVQLYGDDTQAAVRVTEHMLADAQRQLAAPTN